MRFTFTRPGRITRFRGPPLTGPAAFPIRAAFYYAWYPEAWSRQSGLPVQQLPSVARLLRDGRRADRPRAHRRAALRAPPRRHLLLVGPVGYPLTDVRFWRYLAAARDDAVSLGDLLRARGLREPERREDPLRPRVHPGHVRRSKPAYLKVDGRFVVFVYGGADDTCESTSATVAARQTPSVRTSS